MAGGRLTLPLADPVIDASGAVAPGASLTVYQTGTETLADMFSDPGLTTPVTNPQTSNSAGRFYDQTTSFFLDDSAAYDVVLGFPDGSFVTYDAVSVVAGVTGGGGFAPINSPNFTGVPTAPTPATNDNSNKIATTAYVQAQGYAPLASPAFTGDPTAPTPPGTDNSTTIATTAFVQALVSGTATFTGTSIYLKLNNGFVLQAGRVADAITGPTVKTLTFPVNYANACVFCGAIIDNTVGATSAVTGVSVRSAPTIAGQQFLFNGFQSGSYQTVPGYWWFALGY